MYFTHIVMLILTGHPVKAMLTNQLSFCQSDSPLFLNSYLKFHTDYRSHVIYDAFNTFPEFSLSFIASRWSSGKLHKILVAVLNKSSKLYLI